MKEEIWYWIIDSINQKPSMNPTLASYLLFEIGVIAWNLMALCSTDMSFLDSSSFFSEDGGSSLKSSDRCEWRESEWTALFYQSILLWKEVEELQDTPSPDPSFSVSFSSPPFSDDEVESILKNVRSYLVRKRQSRNKDPLSFLYAFPFEEGRWTTSSRKWMPLQWTKTAPARIQTYLTPFFFKNDNWFSEKHWRAIDDIGKQFFPEYENDMHRDIEFVYNTSRSLTDEQKVWAEFWSGSEAGRCTPPTMWFSIAVLIASRHLCSDLRNAVLFLCTTTFVLYHAAIGAWYLKYKYQQARPIQTVRHQYRNQHESQWMPYKPPDFVTPPFPDFVSGHSTFSSACATLFTHWLGSSSTDCISRTVVPVSVFRRFSSLCDNNNDNEYGGCTFSQWFICPSHTSKIQEGLLPQCMEWTSWFQMANQAGLSRIYGGIHYPSSHLGGMALGEWVTHSLLHDNILVPLPVPIQTTIKKAC